MNGLRILSAKQIRELDAHTIRTEPVASIDLMERASRAFVDWFTLHVEVTKKTGVVCGTGNNGGDGLAIARILAEWGYHVSVWIVEGGGGASDDFKTNLGRLPAMVHKSVLESESDEVSFDACDVLIDAVFGSGLSRPPAGLYAKVIDRMNESPALRIAVDIPSGLMADSHSSGSIVRADYTISFQLPKLAFFHPETYAFTGEWVLVDIGLNKDFIRAVETPHHYVRLKDVRKILRPRARYDHKGTFGHALLIAGSYGKMGAAVLAARAALRAGIGLLSVHVPGCGYEIMQTAVPEAMAQVDAHDKYFSDPPVLTAYSTLGIGPGLGQNESTKAALRSVLEKFGKPVVLDADALNIIANGRHLLNLIPVGSILTPHPKEFERLTGPWKDDFERLEMLGQLAVTLKSVVVLKGAYTAIATGQGRIYFNSTGNPGMASGGTGDVLTGLITGMLAQKYTPVEAAVAGVFIHGLAGDLAVQECGMDALIASDLIDHIPAAQIKIARK
jgi:ADP-dependent NAD(P)H-hydrate dehydratase / NAD(P)H-hydrate epimerase